MKPDRRVSKLLRQNGLFLDRDSAVVYDAEIVPHLLLEGSDIMVQRQRVFHRGKQRCKECRVIVSDIFGAPWEMDHIQGGLAGRCDCLHNLQILCRDCHIKKHGRYLRWGEGRAQALKDFEKVME